MRLIRVIVRPAIFENGGKYLLRLRQDNGHDPVYMPVKFINYDPCPALVTVGDNDGKLLRVPREDLFTCEVAPYE